MKNFLTLVATAILIWLAGASAVSGAAGSIHLSVTPPGTVSLCDTVTVTVALSGYTDLTEVDGYNFRILYDPARFAVVSNSASLHDAAGPAQNWLRYPAQENMGGLLLSDFTAFDPGVIHVSVADMRLAPDPLNPRGSAAAAGFLYEVQLTALAAGGGVISVAPAVGDSILYSALFNPVSVPVLSTASAGFTVTGVRLQIQRTGASQATITWPKGVLESTDALGATWTPIPGATNSLIVPLTGPRRFYRAVTP